MESASNQVDALISEVQSLGWKSDPMKGTMQIAREHHEALRELVLEVMDRLPEGGNFLEAALSFLPENDWPEVIERAIAVLESAPNPRKLQGAAKSVIGGASLQCTANLQPYLERLFALDDLFGASQAVYMWRGSSESQFPALREQFEKAEENDKNVRPSPRLEANRRLRAWRAMLETRCLPVMNWAIQHVPDPSFSPGKIQIYLFLVGYERREDTLCRLYPEKVFHLCFEKGYIPPQPKHIGDHPTWHLQGQTEGQRFGGRIADANCDLCGQPLHHLLTLAPVPAGLGVSGFNSLSLATCLSCLSWEEIPLFYHHNDLGAPSAWPGKAGAPAEFKTPQFPSPPLRETQISLIETPPCWKWQEDNARENLHRVGGHPSWVQEAEYPVCPNCNRTMNFLLQLDSDLPLDAPPTPVEERTFDWGSGGISYGFWCDECRVSAFLWQCT